MKNITTNKKDELLESITDQIRLDFRKLSKTKPLNLVDVKYYFVREYNTNNYIRDNYSYPEFIDKIITINGLSDNHQKFIHCDPGYVNHLQGHPCTVRIVHARNHEGQ